ncbi:Ig-like domain-containing protein [Myxococcota bacterium]|nr:Ig-like domain-containing protein [Myxococcota bacterium]MBU1379757.1 Ig-like domain-containing protein [Myxococcota bacterium]MBU1498530.1 Ig-like domain-containing protein [Myxococcota bacterium]
MKKLLFILMSLTLLAFAGCDDDNSSSVTPVSAQQSSMEISDVLYSAENEHLFAAVTVTASDAQGNPLPGRYVNIISTSELVTSDASNVLTDAQGTAVINLISHNIIDATITAQISDYVASETAVTVDATEVVSFSLTVSGEALAPEYSHSGAIFDVAFSVSDSQGAVEGALIDITSPSGVTTEDATGITDESGLFVTKSTTALSGYSDFDISIAGIVDPFPLSILFYGPEIGGDLSVGLSYAHMTHPRVTAMGIIPGENTITLTGTIENSVPVSPMDLDANWQLNLPIIPPEDMMFSVDGGEAALTLPVIFDDLNENEIFDEGEEYLIAAKLTGGLPVFMAPDTGESVGWMLMEELADNPVFLDWDTNHLDLDIVIYNAPVRFPVFAGSVTDTDYTSKRIAFIAVSATELENVMETPDFWTIFSNPQYSYSLLDTPVDSAGNYSGDAEDPMAVLSAAQLDEWKQEFDVGAGHMVQQLLIFPLYYQDVDGSGSFTAGDLPAGSLQPPPGAHEHISYVLNLPDDIIIFSGEQLWLHRGYNLWGSPLDYSITAMANAGANHNFTLDTDELPEMASFSFVVRDPSADDEDPPVASGVFSTLNSTTVQTESCTGCENVTTGMEFIVTQTWANTTFVDWSEPLNFGLFN